MSSRSKASSIEAKVTILDCLFLFCRSFLDLPNGSSSPSSLPSSSSVIARPLSKIESAVCSLVRRCEGGGDDVDMCWSVCIVEEGAEEEGGSDDWPDLERTDLILRCDCDCGFRIVEAEEECGLNDSSCCRQDAVADAVGLASLTTSSLRNALVSSIDWPLSCTRRSAISHVSIPSHHELVS